MGQSEEPAIIVEGVSKAFRIPLDKSSGIKQHAINFFKRKKGYREFKALNDVSFEIKKGEFFGIVGRNGSGKSTLLKLLAGIYTPDSGAVQVSGSLTPFIELGVGFNPELTGRENVFLNGALLGFSKKEMEAMYDGIVDFAELHDFMEERLKNYSSGMQVRLAFSIAIRAQSDILLLDEVLAVGDEAFQKKCFTYFAELKKKQKTVILVTHDMDAVQRFCSKAALLHEGKVELIGSTGKVTKAYQALNRDVPQDTQQPLKDKPLKPLFDVSVSLELSNQHGREITMIEPKDTLVFSFIITTKIILDNVLLGFTIQKSSGEFVYWFTTEAPNPVLGTVHPNKPVKVSLQLQNVFGEDSYSANISVKSIDRSKEYLIQDEALKFQVVNRGKNGWMLHPDSIARIEV